MKVLEDEVELLKECLKDAKGDEQQVERGRGEIHE